MTFALSLELLRMTDAYTDELFALPERLAYRIVFPVSRLVVDPERLADDDQKYPWLRGAWARFTPKRPPVHHFAGN